MIAPSLYAESRGASDALTPEQRSADMEDRIPIQGAAGVSPRSMLGLLQHSGVCTAEAWEPNAILSADSFISRHVLSHSCFAHAVLAAWYALPSLPALPWGFSSGPSGPSGPMPGWWFGEVIAL